MSLAFDTAKEHGYPHELWTTRLLTRHARAHCAAAGHDCLSRLSQGTLCKILAKQEIKAHKMRYYLQRRDPDFARVLASQREFAAQYARWKSIAYLPVPPPEAQDGE